MGEFKGWKLINLLTGRGNESSPVNDILVNDKIVSDDQHISESFNDFFVNIGRDQLWPLNQRKGTPITLTHISATFRIIQFQPFDSLIYHGKCRAYAKKLKSVEKHWP